MSFKQITILLLTVCIYQIANCQTTETEYNYITKGLKDDKDKGRDIKDGYKMVKIEGGVEITSSDKKWRSAGIYYFKKGTVNKAIILECKDQDHNLRYLCIPSPGSDQSIWDRMFSDINSTGKEWHLVIAYTMSKLASAKLL